MSEKTILDIVDTAVKIGLGALISGLGAYLMAKLNYNNEKLKWVRTEKLKALSDLSKELLSLGFESLSFDDRYKFNAIASKAILLIDDETLIKRIEDFIEKLVQFTTYQKSKILNLKKETTEKKNLLVGIKVSELQQESRYIVAELKKNLSIN